MPENRTKKDESKEREAKQPEPQKKEAAKKSPSKKKALFAAIAAFLLAGGVMFLIMIFIGTKDIKDQDARMNFSFGNVIAGAVAPLFDALGVSSEKENVKNILSTLAENNMAKFRQLDLSDWLGLDGSSSGNTAKGFGGGGTGSSSSGHGQHGGGGTPTEIQQADFGMSGGFGGGGGSSSSSSSSGRGEGGNTFSQTSAKNLFASGKNGTQDGKGLPSMKGKNALNTARASRDMLKNATLSGSAVIARSEWASGFGQGKSTGFQDGKKNPNVFSDANAARLDKIESGAIKSLKDPRLANKDASIPTASMPESVEDDEEVKKAKENGKKKKTDEELFSSIKNAKPVESGDSDSGKDSEEKVPKEISDYANTKAPDGPWQNKTSEALDCRTDELKSCEVTYKESKPKFSKTEDGQWIVTYKGTMNITSENADGKKEKMKVPITTTYLVEPGSNPPTFSSCCISTEGEYEGLKSCAQ